jgi:hypothetical protein
VRRVLFAVPPMAPHKPGPNEGRHQFLAIFGAHGRRLLARRTIVQALFVVVAV